MKLNVRCFLRNSSSRYTHVLALLTVLAGLLVQVTAHAQALKEDAGQFQLQPRSRPSLLGPDPTPPTHRVRGVKYKVNRLDGDNTANPDGIVRTNVTPTCKNPLLTYFNGPVISNVQPVVVFWSSHVNSQLTAPTTGIAQFLADIGSSPIFGVLSQYSSFGNSITDGTDQWIGSGNSAVSSYTLVPSKCSGTTNCTVSDADIQNELNAQIVAGQLPAPVYDSQGNDNTVYMTYFPPNVTVSGPDGAGDSCVEFCAYHNTGIYSANGQPLVYGVLMDEFTTACNDGCGGNETQMENMTDTSSHELAEAITDADIGLDTGADYAYPAAWGDNNNNCGEIADICDTGGAGNTFTVGGRTWTTQQLWSNRDAECESSAVVAPPYSFFLHTSITAGVPFNFNMIVENPTGGTYTGYLGTVHFTSSDPSATLPADYTFTSADGGSHSFQATLVTGTSQTITATDAAHPTITGSGSFPITQPPAPVLTSPAPGSTFAGPSATFTWTSVSGSQGYWLFLGTTGVGSKNLYDSNQQSATSATFSNLPTDGVTIYARVYAKVNGTLYYNDYTYTAAIAPPVLTSPAPGSTLTGTTTTFTWTASGGQGYWLFIGTTGVGSDNLYDSHQQSANSATVSGLPSNGVKLYVRVYSRVNGTLYYNDYTYTSYIQPPVMTSPTPGTTLAGSSVTFSWTTVTGAQGYWLFLGTTGVGSKDLYDSNEQAATSATFSNLPTNGVKIYARVYARYNGVLVYNDYTYTAE